jgi:hypothetical protein
MGIMYAKKEASPTITGSCQPLTMKQNTHPKLFPELLFTVKTDTPKIYHAKARVT